MQNLTHSLAETRHPSKVCSKCRVEKPLNDFQPDASKASGHSSHCKECKAAYQRQRRAANPEASRDYYRDYRKANPRIQWANAEYRARYYSENPHRFWAGNYRTRALKFGFVPVVEDFTRADVIALYGDACAHCGGPFEHLDHFPIAVALGGHHTLNNVRPSCAPCNTSQGDPTRRRRDAMTS